MSASIWTWTYADADGQAIDPAAASSGGFPTQADAEGWVGEVWPDLLAEGVESVTLHHESAVVYGPMSLRPAQ